MSQPLDTTMASSNLCSTADNVFDSIEFSPAPPTSTCGSSKRKRGLGPQSDRTGTSGHTFKRARNAVELDIDTGASADQTTSERSSRFLEGSMTDTPSRRLPDNLTPPNASRNGYAIDSLMADYHDPAFDHHSSAAPAAPHAIKHRQSSVFRFGRKVASTFNPVSVWKSITKTWDETKEDLTIQNIEANRRKVQPTARADSVISNYNTTPGPLTPAPFREGLLRDDDDTPRRQQLKPSKSLFSLKDSSLGTIRRVRSSLTLNSPSLLSLHPTPSTPLTSTHHTGHLRPSESKRELGKQKKLTKKVSMLEVKLEEARLELERAMEAATPYVNPAPHWERFTPRFALSPRPAHYVPSGLLPSVPSERTLFPPRQSSMAAQVPAVVPRMSSPHREAPLVETGNALGNEPEVTDENGHLEAATAIADMSVNVPSAGNAVPSRQAVQTTPAAIAAASSVDDSGHFEPAGSAALANASVASLAVETMTGPLLATQSVAFNEAPTARIHNETAETNLDTISHESLSPPPSDFSFNDEIANESSPQTSMDDLTVVEPDHFPYDALKTKKSALTPKPKASSHRARKRRSAEKDTTYKQYDDDDDSDDGLGRGEAKKTCRAAARKKNATPIKPAAKRTPPGKTAAKTRKTDVSSVTEKHSGPVEPKIEDVAVAGPVHQEESEREFVAEPLEPILEEVITVNSGITEPSRGNARSTSTSSSKRSPQKMAAVEIVRPRGPTDHLNVAEKDVQKVANDATDEQTVHADRTRAKRGGLIGPSPRPGNGERADGFSWPEDCF